MKQLAGQSCAAINLALAVSNKLCMFLYFKGVVLEGKAKQKVLDLVFKL